MPVQFGGAFYADGAFPAKFTTKNNIALMTRTEEPIFLEDLEKWCTDVNRFGSKSLVLADIDLNACRTPDDAAAAITSVIPNWPSRSHGHLMSRLIKRLFDEPVVIMKHSTKAANQVRVYGPAIDRFWPLPVLGNNFSNRAAADSYTWGRSGFIPRICSRNGIWSGVGDWRNTRGPPQSRDGFSMLRFGVAGFPPAFVRSQRKRDQIEVFEWLAELGLNAFEIQMTYGPRLSKELCERYAQAAESLGIRLSIHASYFIVMTSSDPVKVRNSIDTLARTYELANILGAREVVLHPGPLYGRPAAECISDLISNLDKFFASIGPTPIGLFLETAGKVGQLGSIEEILEVTGAIPGTYPCVDFGHVHART